MATAPPARVPPPNAVAAPFHPPAPARAPRHRRRRHGHLALVAQSAVIASFAALATAAHWVRADGPDVWVTDRLQRLHRFRTPLQAVGWPGYPPQNSLTFGTLSLAVFALGYRTQAAFLLGSAAGGGALVVAVKTVVGRPRPLAAEVQVVRHVGGYSFPSAHVVSYVSGFGFLAYLAGIDLSSPALRALIIGSCLGMLLLIGPSRIYMGAHWASDVLGAYLLGGLWLSVVLRAYVAWLDHEGIGHCANHNGR